MTTEVASKSRVSARPVLKAPRSLFNIIVAVVCFALAILILYPLAETVFSLLLGGESVIDAAQRVYGDPRLGVVLWNTAYLMVGSVGVAVVVGSLLAWLNERTNVRIGWASDVLPVMSLLVPSIAGSIGLIILFSPGVGYVNVVIGMLNDTLGIQLPELNIFTPGGMIFAYSVYLIPQVYLVVAAAMRNIDPAMEEAARVSGRKTFTILRTITLPAVRPAIISGALLALIYGLATFSVPLLIGTEAGIPVLTVEIVHLITLDFPPDLLGATLLSLILLAAVLLGNLVVRKVGASSRHSTIGGRPSGSSVLIFRPGARLFARALMLLYIVLSCILPVIALAYVAMQPFWNGQFTTQLNFNAFIGLFAEGSQTANALRNSVILGVVAATICVILGVLVTYHMGRTRRFSGVLSGIFKLPGIVSHLILAIALLSAFAGPPFNLGGTTTILLIAYVVIYFTYAAVTSEAAALQVGKDLKDASSVSGRGPAYTLRAISLPLMLPALAAGWVFVFVLAMGDITASAILAGPNSPVVGFTMLSLFQNSTYAQVTAFATVITVISSVVVGAVLIFTGRAERKKRRG
ncbi:ABC transporter permease [Microbacterium pygmaeum]|uniref:Iron(III) transport system permease protein n=1 Tax=Microbacterium pygmaeum TaxID=370764 RepID=A0A1G7XJU9_9MICO|nr:iron ABC transporter permease [Microbacterium pygmaeum]SDG84386.1 iron(III) transport system permease protein [Microbacterium pygmaeum]